jgi:hypothetical protein
VLWRISRAAELAADLLGVPEHQHKEFVEGVVTLVELANLGTGKNTDARLLAAAKAVRAAHGAVAKLTTRQKHLLRFRLRNRFHRLSSGVQDDNLVLALMSAMDAELGDWIGRSPHAPSGKRGKPRGAKAQWKMHAFVVQLWVHACQRGMKVTLSNSGGQAAGTIVALLNVLKQVLPERFFPGILNYSFLRGVQKSLPSDLAEVEPLDFDEVDVSVYSE